jgi:16S rRNA processing protein RimM
VSPVDGGSPDAPVLNDPVVVGRLTSSYGVRGWIKVHSFTDPMENFLGYQQLYLQQQGQWRPLAVEEGKLHGKGVVVKLRGVDTPEQARLYSGVDVAIDASELPPLEADEFYWHQLEGLRVLVGTAMESAQLLGRVDHLLETGANDVLVVTPCEGSIDGRERLIPYLPDDVVKVVDLAAGALLVEWDPEF